MNTLVFTSYIQDYLVLRQYVVPNHEEYCRKHGYSYIVRERGIGGVDYSKRDLVKEILPESKYASLRTMNSFYYPGTTASYQPGDFIIHFFCCGLSDKEKFIREFVHAA